MNKLHYIIRSLFRTFHEHKFTIYVMTSMLCLLSFFTFISNSIFYNSSTDISTGLGGRQIEVIAGLGGENEPPLDSSAADEFSKMEHVEFVYSLGYLGVDPPKSLMRDNKDISPWWLAPQNEKDSRVKDISGNPVPAISYGEILVPSEYSYLVNEYITLGTTVMLTADTATGKDEEFHVIGTYDPETVQGEPTGTVFINSGQFNDLQKVGALPGISPYSSIFIYIDDIQNVKSVQQNIEAMGFSARSAQGAGVELAGFRSTISLSSIVLIMVAMLSSLFAGIFISGSWIKSRIEEIGLFRSIGWTMSDIKRFYILESFFLSFSMSLISCVFSIILILISSLYFDNLFLLKDFSLSSDSLKFVWIIFIIPIVAIASFMLGALRGIFEMRKFNTDELLRRIN